MRVVNAFAAITARTTLTNNRLGLMMKQGPLDGELPAGPSSGSCYRLSLVNLAEIKQDHYLHGNGYYCCTDGAMPGQCNPGAGYSGGVVRWRDYAHGVALLWP